MAFYSFLPKLINMSLTASVAIVCVILLRMLLKKAPKVISYAMWGVVLFRLLCPVSVESNFSFFNLLEVPIKEAGTLTSVMEYVPNDIVHTEYPAVTLPVPGISKTVNQVLPQGEEQLRADPLEGPIFLATCIWLAGVSGMAIYSLISYVQLRRKLLVAVPVRENILIADDIKSPFVVGLFDPKIYLPCNLGDREQEYIILHEQHHIRRLDHVMKALAFLALTVHWFNPLVWMAFILAGKDMEMSCDEAVIRMVGSDVRADYSASLLTLATGRRIIAGTPLAFGEGDTKGRINNLAKWKKPTVWIVLVAVIACVVLAVCLLTNPETKQDLSFLNYENLVSVAAQSDTHSASKSEDPSRYIIDGPQLAKFLDVANWTAQTGITRSVQRDTERNSKSSIQITLNGMYLKAFDIDTANIYDMTTGKDRYYRMSDGDYEKLSAMLSRDHEYVDDYEAMYTIVEIVDPTDDPNFAYDTATEKIYEDNDYMYYLSGLYSQNVIVHYANGKKEDIVSALNSKRAMIEDLKKFDVEYRAISKYRVKRYGTLDAAVSAAILDHYRNDDPNGLLYVKGNLILHQETDKTGKTTVIAMSLCDKYDIDYGYEHWYEPVILTFGYTKEQGYYLADSWFPTRPAKSWDALSNEIYEKFSAYSEDLANSALNLLNKGEHHDTEWIKENRPEIWALLQMINE